MDRTRPVVPEADAFVRSLPRSVRATVADLLEQRPTDRVVLEGQLASFRARLADAAGGNAFIDVPLVHAIWRGLSALVAEFDELDAWGKMLVAMAVQYL